MAIIQVTPEILRSKATELRGIKDEHDQAMAKMRTLILGLNETFKGAAHDAYVAKYEGMASTFTQFSQMIEDYAKMLDTTATSMETTDAESARIIQGQ